MKQLFYLLLFVLPIFTGFSQEDNFRFKALLEKDASTKVAFAVKNTAGTLPQLLANKEINVKSVTPDWIYIQATPQWIADAKKSKLIEQFYFEYSNPVALNDTARAYHHVNEVHDGSGGLQSPFTGKNVIIGYVDTGLDYTHEDFIDSNGNTRVLYYWDHSMPFDAVRTPMPYGYGQLWYGSDIQNGTALSPQPGVDTGHGTTVAGAGSSNARANGQEKGMAPDSKIIIIQTNFSLPNWSLTVADACDFIFKKADSLGLPAVVNLSVGSYLGSHDGNDPAAELIENLVEEKGGRIVICAAGNSGHIGKYHVHGDVDSDTSFVWALNAPSGSLGSNFIYMDLWTDLADASWNYGLAANLPSGDFSKRGQTGFRPAITGVGGVVRDTIYNGLGNRIAIVELYPEIVGANLHIEIYFSTVDSTSYNYAFQTTGSGNYDLWSGAGLGLNNFVSSIPSVGIYPPIAFYNSPDTLQTIVSAWNCSEKIISVGNIRNRLGHTDFNGNPYFNPANVSAVKALSHSSSKGPSRHNVVKPDIACSGDIMLSAAPQLYIGNSGYWGTLDQDGLHARNGGTSMASPVVAGIAALYLEKCNKGTFQSFKDDMITSAFSDGFTGILPNYGYGHGKIHALNLLLESNYTATVVGATQYCGSDSLTTNLGASLDSVVWSTGATTPFLPLTSAGSYSFTSYDNFGCVSHSDTLTVILGDIPATPTITPAGNVLSTAPFTDLQWYENGILIPGATSNTITITLPSSSEFTVIATGSTGCEVESAAYNPSASINELETNGFIIFPNPSSKEITIKTGENYKSLVIKDVQGKVVKRYTTAVKTIDVSNLATGTYVVEITTTKGEMRTKFVKE